MNIYEMSRRYGIGLRKLRAMATDGEIAPDEPDPLLAPIEHCLARQGSLTAEHCVTLIERPDLLAQLPDRYRERARGTLTELDKPSAAPSNVAWATVGAQSGDTHDVETIMAWAKQVLPPKPVNHIWLVVRLLLGLPEDQRKPMFPRMRRVMLNLRKHPDFAGWWTVKPEGSRNVTWYHRPKGVNL